MTLWSCKSVLLKRCPFFWDVVKHYQVIGAVCSEITVLSQNIEHQSPSDTAPHPENRGLKCTAVKLVRCYFYWMVVEQIISKRITFSNQRFILFCEKHIHCWKYLIWLLVVDMLYHFHIFYRCWSAYSLDLGILTLNTGLYLGR